MDGNSLLNRCPRTLPCGTFSMSTVRVPTHNLFGDADVVSAFQPPVNRRKPDVPKPDIPRSNTPKSDIRKSGYPKSESRKFGRSYPPSFWSCGVVVGIIFCLMNKQVNAHPLQDSQIEMRSERNRRSAASEDFLDRLAMNWFLHRSLDRKGTPRTFKSRVSRSISDQIINELERDYLDKQLGSGATHPTSARQRRFAPPRVGGSDLIINEIEADWLEKRLASESTQVPASSRTRRFAPANADRLFALADADRRVGSELILNELESQWHDANIGTDSASRTRTKRSTSLVEDAAENAAAVNAAATNKAKGKPESRRAFRDQRLADLVRQRLGQDKSKSGLLAKLGGRGGGSNGEDLDGY